jgi:hypothetical protein
MNISESELPVKIVAKTCGCKEKKGRYHITLFALTKKTLYMQS